MPTWPVNAVQYLDVTIAPLEQRAVFDADLGAPKTAPLDRRSQHAVRFDAIMDGGELQDLMTWWEVDLHLGSLDFDGLQDVVGDTSARYKFEGVPGFMVLRGASFAGDRLWRVPLELWEVVRATHVVFDEGDRVLDGADVVVDWD